MNSRSLRRLAADHASLRSAPLPPNYFFSPENGLTDDLSDLTKLEICLAGPPTTPFEAGLFRLHLAIPSTYPDEPPKAYFKTKIFHPNVDESTGAVCVETLKRDWDRSLTLRDVLVTVNCLLVVPNPSSALNAEAGMLLEQEDGWEAFAKRARFMTSIHAKIASGMRRHVLEAQQRGEDTGLARTRRGGKIKSAEVEDIFGPNEQENRRAQTPPTPTLDDSFDVSNQDIEAEYPPSPKKSPVKGRLQQSASPVKVRLPLSAPPDLLSLVPEPIRGTRARRSVLKRQTRGPDQLDPTPSDKVRKVQTRTSPRRTARSAEETRRLQLEAELWDACGQSVERWNRGDFGGKLHIKTPRW